MTAPTNLDLHLGSPVLPAQVRRVRADHRGALSFTVETEDHDRGLLRSLAAAVREEPGVAALLARYADLTDLIDAETDPGMAATLRSDAEDVLTDIEAEMGWQQFGEPLTASLRPQESTVLADALSGKAVAA